MTMYSSEAHQRRRAAFLAMKRCPICSGKNRLNEGETVCPECRDKVREYGRTMRERRRAAGQCVKCGGPQDREGSAYCSKCATKKGEARQHEIEKKRALYHERKEAGLCVDCGAWAEPGRTLCKVHMAMRARSRANRVENGYNEKMRQMRERRKAEGLCIDCGKPRGNNGTAVRCEACMARSRDSARKQMILKKIKREADELRRQSDEIRKASRAKWERDAAGWRTGAE